MRLSQINFIHHILLLQKVHLFNPITHSHYHRATSSPATTPKRPHLAPHRQ